MATTRKPAAKPAPAAKKPGTALKPWEAAMASAAQKQAKAEKPTGSFKNIGTRGGILTIDDSPIPDNELRCVILLGCPENQLYDGPFDPNTPQTPICYAFGDPDSDNPEDGMKPHEQASDPQSDTCEGCQFNEWGSADQGRGKACKNVRRLLLMTEDALESADTIAEAEVRMLKVSVTSVKNWSKYVHRLEDECERPSWGVITTLKAVPDVKSQFKLLFTFEELIDFNQKTYDALQLRIKEATKDVVAPYPDMSDIEQPAPKGRKVVPIKRAAPGKPMKGQTAGKPAARKR